VTKRQEIDTGERRASVTCLADPSSFDRRRNRAARLSSINRQWSFAASSPTLRAFVTTPVQCSFVHLELVTGIAAAISFALHATMMAGFAWAWSRRRRRTTRVDRAPRVSILRPLAGCDDELAANLESLTALDYPSIEILLGVASIEDPAWPVARAFVAAHPELDVRVVATDPDAAINPKVAQLIGLERAATGEIVLVSDSNVRVSREYLWPIVAELEDPSVGIVSSVIAGTGERTLGAALENLQLCAVIAPQIIAAMTVVGCAPSVGKSMALRRRDLARLGGFAVVGGVLAEDHVLGRIVRKSGMKARIVLEPVENRNVACSVRRTLERHTRWAKLRRAISPLGFTFEPLLSPTITCAAALIVTPSRAFVLLLALAIAVQTMFAQISLVCVRGRGLPWKHAPLELVRTLVLFVCWLGAWASRRIAWRGHPFLIGADSSITPAPATRFEAWRKYIARA